MVTGKFIAGGSTPPPPSPPWLASHPGVVRIFVVALCFVCREHCKCWYDSQLGSNTDYTIIIFLIRGVGNNCQNWLLRRHTKTWYTRQSFCKKINTVVCVPLLPNSTFFTLLILWCSPQLTEHMYQTSIFIIQTARDGDGQELWLQ